MTVSEGQLLSSDHLSAVKDGTVAQVSLSEAPERKPLPATAAATAAANASVGGGSPGGLTSLYSKLFSRYRGLDKRKRRLVIALAIVAVAALLGLIIGLSVGLTVGKKYVCILTTAFRSSTGKAIYVLLIPLAEMVLRTFLFLREMEAPTPATLRTTSRRWDLVGYPVQAPTISAPYRMSYTTRQARARTRIRTRCVD